MKSALITGATSGIGEALAHLLASKGIALILSGRSAERLEKIASEVGAKKTILADLQDKHEREKLVQVIHKELPDLVINCAGFGVYGDPLTIPVATQLTILEVGAAAPLEITLEAVRAWVKAGKKGVVMNVSSVAGESPCPGMSVYGASKAFLTQVSQALNTELAGKEIHILVSCPGMVATDFANRAAKRQVSLPQRFVMTPQHAAEQIWRQIQNRKGKHIFSLQYRLSSWCATHLLPSSLTQKIIWNQIKQRL